MVDAGDVIALPPVARPRHATLLPFVETALQLTLDAGPVLEETVVVSGARRRRSADGRSAAAGRGAGHRRRATAVAPRARQPSWARPPSVPTTSTRRSRQPVEPDGVALVIEVSGNPAGAAGRAATAGLSKARRSSGRGTAPARRCCRSATASTAGASRSAARRCRRSRLDCPSRWDRRRRQRTVVRAAGVDAARSSSPRTSTPSTTPPPRYAAIDAGEEGLIHLALGYS